jgi:hypothetical protein
MTNGMTEPPRPSVKASREGTMLCAVIASLAAHDGWEIGAELGGGPSAPHRSWAMRLAARAAPSVSTGR